ncbi:MAG: hypothetical protein ACI9MC_003508 [Kiritimatiellia bacterium]
MSEPGLKREMSGNGDDIYQDINGPQKRANWNLLRALAQEHGIDLTSDVESHENVQAVTIGEGESAEGFVDARREWPQKIAALGARIVWLAGDPGAHPSQLSKLRELLRAEEEKCEAVYVDDAVQEENALEGETVLGEEGAATPREGVRTEFWADSHPSTERLNSTLTALGLGYLPAWDPGDVLHEVVQDVGR